MGQIVLLPRMLLVFLLSTGSTISCDNNGFSIHSYDSIQIG